MPRVKRAVHAAKKRREIMAQAKGYYGARSRRYRVAKEQVMHSLTYAYRDRRDRKGQFRRLWITRIGAAARAGGLTYSAFMHGLQGMGLDLDRRVLADLAVTDPNAFGSLVEAVKAGIEAEGKPKRTRPARRTPRA
jgi:large subunit ribosomal protein L20